MHSESILSRLVVSIFFNYTFVMKAPLCRVCDVGVFPDLQGIILEDFFSCVGRIQGATQSPSPSKYFEKSNIYSETILAD